MLAGFSNYRTMVDPEFWEVTGHWGFCGGCAGRYALSEEEFNNNNDGVVCILNPDKTKIKEMPGSKVEYLEIDGVLVALRMRTKRDDPSSGQYQHKLYTKVK